MFLKAKEFGGMDIPIFLLLYGSSYEINKKRFLR